jgi:7-cyano-7-deazaguanine synthase
LVTNYYLINYPDKISKRHIDISTIMAHFSSNLLAKYNQSIPEGYYTDASMEKTVVPSRNLIFASIMAGIAESIGVKQVALGVHAGDHPIYPDCRPEFVQALNETIQLSSGGKVEVLTPFVGITKADILSLGYKLPVPVPYHLTRSCYKNQPISCGKCGTCQERLEAFSIIGRKDPIQYEEMKGRGGSRCG